MPYQIPEGDKKYKYVQNNFSRIAEKYDLFNDLFTLRRHRSWKRFLLKKTGLKKGDTALDICCGTGDITSLVESAVAPWGMSIGLDFSSGMLNIAKARNNINSSIYINGDTNKLPFKDSSFNVVTVGYGLRNLVNYSLCLNEVFRVLKSGGRFLCLETGKVEAPMIKQLSHLYFFHIIPKIGKILYPNEDFFEYFPKSSIDFPSQENLTEMLKQCGFKQVNYYNFIFGNTVVHYCVK